MGFPLRISRRGRPAGRKKEAGRAPVPGRGSQRPTRSAGFAGRRASALVAVASTLTAAGLAAWYVSGSRSPAAWFGPEALLAVATVGGLLWLRCRACERAEVSGQRRTAAFLAGSAALLVAEAPPLAVWADRSLLTAHLIQITLAMAVAAPLLVLAVPTRTESAHDTRRSTAPRLITGARETVERVAHLAINPIAATLIFNITFLGWHTEPLFDSGLHDGLIATAEQTTLFLAAVIFWWPVIRPAAEQGGLSPMARLGYLAVSLIPQTFGGITIALAHHVIYGGYGAGPSLAGWDAMTDQEVAGSCIALLNKIALITAFFIVLARFLGSESSDDGGPDDDDRRHPHPQPVPSAPPSAIPPWYSSLVEDPSRTTREPGVREGAPTPQEKRRSPIGVT